MKRNLLLVLFSVFCFGAVTAAELNIYASGLRVNSVDEANQVSISYFLNAPATALEFQLINSSTDVVAKTVAITASGDLTKGSHTTTIDLGDALGGTYKWALKATAANKGSLTLVSNTESFYATRGVAINNYPETDNFGYIYVSLCTSGTSNSIAKTKGIFVYNPAITCLNPTSTTGIKDATWVADGAGSTAVGSPYRVTVAEDGEVYVSCSKSPTGVWKLPNGDPNQSLVKVVDGGTPYGICVTGTGASRILYTLDGISYSSGCIGNILSYAIGNSSLPYTGGSTTFKTAANVSLGNAHCDIESDKNGGFWMTQNRSADATGLSILSHLTSAGTKNYNSSDGRLSLSNSTRGVVAVNKDGSQVATCSGGAVKVFNVIFSEATPTLSLAYTAPASGTIGTNIDGLAFDYANNLYIVSSTSERLHIYAPAATNTCTTPAPSTQPIALETLVSVVNVTGVTLDEASKTLKVGGSFTLTPTVSPADATDKSYTWSSSDETVATVSDGVVSALKAGTATITVTTTDGSKTATCAVTVEPYTITYNTNGGTLSKTNEELWADFMPAYNEYYDLNRGKQPITAVATFANQYMQDFMTNENSSWKWLGDYISAVTTAAGRSINTDVLWRYGVQAFFNCSAENASGYSGNADFTTAGQPSAWLLSYTTANLPAHVATTYTLPTLVKTNYTFTGWTNGAGAKVTTVNQLADYTVTAHWVLTNPTTLAQAVDGKTIRRTLMNGGKLYVLAIDELKNPYIYKINPETSAVEAIIPTTGCTNTVDLTIATGFTTMPLSDIAFTSDNVLVGMNADHMTYSGGPGTLRLYKWTSQSEAPTLWASSQNASAAGSLIDAITAGAMTFVGNSTTGAAQAVAIIVNKNSPSEFRYAYINLTDGVHQNTRFNRSVASGGTSTIKATTIGTDVQIHPSPLSGDFIITGSLCRPIEVIENATSGETATYNNTEVIDAPTVGSFFFTEDAVKYMAVPTSAGISIYNITSGLATASLVTSVAAANTADYRAVFAVRDEDDLILYLQKDDVISKYTEDNFFGVTINSVTLNKSTTSLVIGATETLTAEIDPDDAVVTVIWSSDDESVATVSDAGVVTAVSAGTAVITATAGDQSDACTVTVTAPIPMSGTYKIGGVEADYASLHAACEDINQRSLSGDVTLLICADLTEPLNSGLVNTTDYTLTIRPDGTTKRTITFGSAPDNAGPSGHVVIGYNLTGWSSIDTKNVIIDGSYNGEGQYLEFQAGSIGGVIVVYYGRVTNSEVRNCRLVNARATNTNYVAHFRTEKDSDKAPTGVGFKNCYMQVTGVDNAQAVYYNGSQSSTAAGKPKDCYLRDCEIVSNLRGIFINGAINATIEGNTFRMPSASGGYIAHAIMGNAQTGTITVRRNKFTELKTNNVNAGSNGIRAITATGGATKWVIENNYFGGIDAIQASAANKNMLLTYIWCSDLCEMRHNTFHMPALSYKPSSALDSSDPIACVRLVGSANHIIKNNLFVSDETTAYNSLISGTLNDNILSNVFYNQGGNAALASSGSTIDDLDESNKWMAVTFADTYKPSFESACNPLMGVTQIAGITTDIEGRTRLTPTHAGCYEAGWGFVLDETATNNSTTISSKAGETTDVLLKRHFTDATAMYTLVLPFDLTDAQLQEAFGAGYKLSVMTDAYWKVEGEVLYLRFDYVNHLEAGMPALLQVGEAVTEDILFRDVTIDASDPENDQTVAVMRGLYDKTTVLADIKSYYLGTGRYLYQYTSGKETKGFRSYFYFPDFESATPCSARIVYRDEVVTDDEPASVQPTADAPQKLIRDGKVVIVVDGVEYDALGRKIQ